MARIKLTLEYDGEGYVGWQVQPNGPSVQERVEAALQRLTGEAVRVEVAGRTDAGVHAAGQVCCFTTARDLPLKAYVKGMAAFLPHDIAVVQAEPAAEDFDPRRDARGKQYRYLLFNARHASPLRRRTHWQLFAPLDVAGMQEASRHLLGRHDFSAFRAADCEAKSAERELWRVDVVPREGGELVITVEGTAFLKHMVRNIVGTLVEVGRGKQPPSWVRELLVSRNRMLSGPTAPPHGLTLVQVFYERPVLPQV